MKLKNGYGGLKEENINNMTEEQMRKVLLRLVDLESVPTDAFFPTDMFLPDEVADVLRDRVL